MNDSERVSLKSLLPYIKTQDLESIVNESFCLDVEAMVEAELISRMSEEGTDA